MSDTQLRSHLIRLAHANPELRPQLLPLLRTAMDFDSPEALKKYLQEHPGADKSLHHVKQDAKSTGAKTPRKRLDSLLSGPEMGELGHAIGGFPLGMHGAELHRALESGKPVAEETARDVLQSLKTLVTNPPKGFEPTPSQKKSLGRGITLLDKVLAGSSKNTTKTDTPTKQVSLSKGDYTAVSDALQGFDEGGAWSHVISYAVSGKPMESMHVRKVTEDIDRYLKTWDAPQGDAQRGKWTAEDKENLTKAKKILDKSLASRHASVNQTRTAHGPIGFTRPDVMLFKIDKEKNNSKFYEMQLMRRGEGWVVHCKWGRLTDKPGGRVDEMIRPFASESLARAGMGKIKSEKMSTGYKEAPNQEYPIGLGGAGFGWGGQKACTYVPELRKLLLSAKASFSQLEELRHAVEDLERKSSAIAPKLSKMYSDSLEGLNALCEYLDGQLGHC